MRRDEEKKQQILIIRNLSLPHFDCVLLHFSVCCNSTTLTLSPWVIHKELPIEFNEVESMFA